MVQEWPSGHGVLETEELMSKGKGKDRHHRGSGLGQGRQVEIQNGLTKITGKSAEVDQRADERQKESKEKMCRFLKRKMCLW